MSIVYRPEIDGLRAISIILVILFHYVNLRGGFVGVDVFFVISGYLITSIIVDKIDNNNFTIREFYERRIRRIFPALITVLIFCLCSGWAFLLATEYENLAKHATFGSIFLTNFVLLNEIGYFDMSSELKPLLHLWSLSIEEQFYIVWPIFIYIVKKNNFNITLAILAVIIISFTYNIYISQYSVSKDFYLPFTRFWELCIGGLLHTNHINKYPLKRWISEIVPLVGLILIISCLELINKTAPYPGYQAIIPTIGASLIIASSSNTFFNKYILSNKLFIFFGLISYPLYLWHWPILSFARIVSEDGHLNDNLKIGGLALSIAMAVLTYFFIEKKIRFNKNKSVVPGLIFCIIIISLLGFFINQNNGLTNRHPEAEANYRQFKLSSEGDIPNLPKVSCKLFSLDNDTLGCFLKDSSNSPNIIVIGDSHAVHNTLGLADYYKDKGKNFSIIYQGGCLPFFNTQVFRGEKETCSTNMNQVLNYALNSSIETIILASRGSWYLNGRELNSKLGMFNIGKSDSQDLLDRGQIFYLGLKNTIEKLHSRNKNIYFIIDNPELSFNPKHCVKTRPYYIEDNFLNNCYQPISETKEYDSLYKNIINKIHNEYPYVKMLDLSKALCDNNFCYAKINEQIVYSDKNHLSMAGSKYVSDFLTKQLNN